MGERRGTKALELWCRRITEGYPGVKVDNMTTSWRDGLAFCALIHHFRPDLIDFSSLKKEDVYHNNELAFRTAESYLGIPALLDAEDMAQYAVPDRLSILTYLSQYYQHFASAGSPNRISSKRASTSSEHNPLPPSPTSSSPPSKMKSNGLGRREPCASCGQPVFLAQRLLVEKRLFHRTCFSCCRCGAQLTLASFHHRPADPEGRYCCETCPDEETDSDSQGEDTNSEDIDTASNQDAFSHDNVSTSSCSHVLSDEDKLRNLQQFKNALAAEHRAFSENLESKITKQTDASRALSGFLNSQFEEDKPPTLPLSSPPTIVSDAFSVNEELLETNNKTSEIGLNNKNNSNASDVNSECSVSFVNSPLNLSDCNLVLCSVDKDSHNADTVAPVPLERKSKQLQIIKASPTPAPRKKDSTEEREDEIHEEINDPPNLEIVGSDCKPSELKNNFSVYREVNIDNYKYKNITKDEDMRENSNNIVQQQQENDIHLAQTPSGQSLVKSRMKLFEQVTTGNADQSVSCQELSHMNSFDQDLLIVSNNNISDKLNSQMTDASEMEGNRSSHVEITDNEIAASIVESQKSESNVPLITIKSYVDCTNNNHELDKALEIVTSNNSLENNESKVTNISPTPPCTTSDLQIQHLQGVGHAETCVTQAQIPVKEGDNSNKTDSSEKELILNVHEIDNSNKTDSSEKELILNVNEIENSNKTDSSEKELILNVNEIKNSNKTDSNEKELILNVNEIKNSNKTDSSEKELILNVNEIDNSNKTDSSEKELILNVNEIDNSNKTDSSEKELILNVNEIKNSNKTDSSEKELILNVNEIKNSNKTDSSEKELILNVNEIENSNKTDSSEKELILNVNEIKNSNKTDSNEKELILNVNEIKNSNKTDSNEKELILNVNEIKNSNKTDSNEKELILNVNEIKNSNKTDSNEKELILNVNEIDKSNKTESNVIIEVSDDGKDLSRVEKESMHGIEPTENISINSQVDMHKVNLYPEELNPFGSEDEETGAVPTSSGSKISTNPFGSDCEDEEEHVYVENRKKSAEKPPRPPPPAILIQSIKEQGMQSDQKKKLIPAPNLNPFGSDDDSDEEDIIQNYSSPPNTSDRVKKIPPSFHGSATSLTGTNRRKKAPAPLPPSHQPYTSLPQDSLTSTNTMFHSNNAGSPQVSPRSRKRRPAPPPPITSSPFSASITHNLLATSSPIVGVLSSPQLDNSRCSSVASQKKVISAAEFDDQDLDLTSSGDWTGGDKLNTSHANSSHADKVSITSQEPSSLSLIKSVTSRHRKGPAPAIPYNSSRGPVSAGAIRRELALLEDQQRGLERQGVRLETLIREKTEGKEPPPEGTTDVETDELLLQLFDLVNEKNELFRRQAELMYLRKQQRLEEEQADLEQQVRVLMSVEESNKTDADKQREENLLARLMDVVQRRDLVIAALDQERLREKAEDQAIRERMVQHRAKLEELSSLSSAELQLSEKKKKKKKHWIKRDKEKKEKSDGEVPGGGSNKKSKHKKWFK